MGLPDGGQLLLAYTVLHVSAKCESFGVTGDISPSSTNNLVRAKSKDLCLLSQSISEATLYFYFFFFFFFVDHREKCEGRRRLDDRTTPVIIRRPSASRLLVTLNGYLVDGVGYCGWFERLWG